MQNLIIRKRTRQEKVYPNMNLYVLFVKFSDQGFHEHFYLVVPTSNV